MLISKSESQRKVQTMCVMVSRGGSGEVREGVEQVDSDIFFIHAPKKTEPGAQQPPRPQWSV